MLLAAPPPAPAPPAPPNPAVALPLVALPLVAEPPDPPAPPAPPAPVLPPEPPAPVFPAAPPAPVLPPVPPTAPVPPPAPLPPWPAPPVPDVPPLAPVCAVPVVAARLAAAATVILPLVPLTVLLAPLILGLQPPPPEPLDPATTGVANATRKIAIVRRDIHLFMRSILSRCPASSRTTSLCIHSTCTHLSMSVSTSRPGPGGELALTARTRNTTPLLRDECLGRVLARARPTLLSCTNVGLPVGVAKVVHGIDGRGGARASATLAIPRKKTILAPALSTKILDQDAEHFTAVVEHLVAVAVVDDTGVVAADVDAVAGALPTLSEAVDLVTRVGRAGACRVAVVLGRRRRRRNGLGPTRSTGTARRTIAHSTSSTSSTCPTDTASTTGTA